MLSKNAVEKMEEDQAKFSCLLQMVLGICIIFL